MKPRAKIRNGRKRAPVTLKTVAEHAGVTPGTVSAVLNNSAASRAFPQSTKNRILAAAREQKTRSPRKLPTYWSNYKHGQYDSASEDKWGLPPGNCTAARARSYDEPELRDSPDS